jgi:hypothetical protein
LSRGRGKLDSGLGNFLISIILAENFSFGDGTIQGESIAPLATDLRIDCRSQFELLTLEAHYFSHPRMSPPFFSRPINSSNNLQALIKDLLREYLF